MGAVMAGLCGRGLARRNAGWRTAGDAERWGGLAPSWSLLPNTRTNQRQDCGSWRHLRWERRLRPFDHSRAFARAALAAGFDVIHGHSAHILHGVEAMGRGLTLYDTGNVIDDYWPLPFFDQHWGCIFLLDLLDGRPSRLRLVPIRTRPWPVRLAQGREKQAMMARMRTASAALGTRLQETAEGLELRLPAGAG
ncbi:CapA family protein [Neoroseomonas lacus]|uniref:CapA family protein n=1 Tax=Neoroseomonas lacus TaxID=287609 RepID=UPI001E30B60C|nr:CapA family protein [Neoroseomonas lacus]